MPHFSSVPLVDNHKGFCYTKQWARDKNRLCSSTQIQRGEEEEEEEEVEKAKEPE